MFKIEFDEAKRQLTLEKRGLDFEDSLKVFTSDHFDVPDERFDYGEPRFLTFGWLLDRPVAIVWTPREQARRIISMRHIHVKELQTRRRALD